MIQAYIMEFQDAVEIELKYEENPEIRHHRQHRLVGDFVAANKREVFLFIYDNLSTTMYEIKYKMPVPEQIAKMFAGQSLEPTGPTFFESHVANDAVPAHVQAAAARFGYQSWAGEVQRLVTKFAGLPDTPENRKIRRTIQNILEYWRGMRTILYNALENVDVIIPGYGYISGSSSSGSSSGSSRPKSVGRSSSSRRHSSRSRYSSAKSHRTSTRRSSPRTSDPKPKGNSDPRRRKP